MTSDDRMLARAEGEHGANRLMENYADLLRNRLSLVAAAGVSQREFIEAQSLFAAKVGFFGRPSA